MTDSNHVTIGVPVYRGELFVEETLRSIQKQTHRDIEVVISLDGPDPSSAELCTPFLRDSRFRLVIQPERLGWVGNINWLMSQARTGFWYYHQQDDLVDPQYVELLLDFAARTPEAAVVYCDIEAFGLQAWKIGQPSVTGSPAARQLALLYDHHPAVAFRGLTRVEALRHSGQVRANEVDNFSADTTWMASIARSGELRRLPAVLYKKRYHADNEHMKWMTWPDEKRIRAWTVHCADMLDEAMRAEATSQERRLLWLASAARLVSARLAGHYAPVAGFTIAERVSMLDRFIEYVRTARALDLPTLLESDWTDIQDWTRGFYAASRVV